MPPNTALNRRSDQHSDVTILLIERLEHLVRSRTGGRVSELHVEVQGTEVILTGRAATFHIKQLATLTNAIEVYC